MTSLINPLSDFVKIKIDQIEGNRVWKESVA